MVELNTQRSCKAKFFPLSSSNYCIQRWNHYSLCGSFTDLKWTFCLENIVSVGVILLCDGMNTLLLYIIKEGYFHIGIIQTIHCDHVKMLDLHNFSKKERCAIWWLHSKTEFPLMLPILNQITVFSYVGWNMSTLKYTLHQEWSHLLHHHFTHSYFFLMSLLF